VENLHIVERFLVLDMVCGKENGGGGYVSIRQVPVFLSFSIC
jgi:hypothetical protein